MKTRKKNITKISSIIATSLLFQVCLITPAQATDLNSTHLESENIPSSFIHTEQKLTSEVSFYEDFEKSLLTAETPAPVVTVVTPSPQRTPSSSSSPAWSSALKVSCTNPSNRIDRAIIPLDSGPYTVTSRLGERWGRYHAGVDMAAPLGTPVHAALSGTVTNTGSAGDNPFIQIRSILADGTTFDHMYLHMPPSSISVKKGDKVTTGQQIAVVGNEGRSTGPHLHFEWHINAGDEDYPSGKTGLTDGYDWINSNNYDLKMCD